MKKRINKKVFWKTNLSIFMLVVFIFMAISSESMGEAIELLLMELISSHEEYSTEGPNKNTYTLREKYSLGSKTISGGQVDGVWDGDITITYESDIPKYYDFTEKVEMVMGKRDGESIITRQDGSSFVKYYMMGKKVDSADYFGFFLKKAEEISAYEQLTDKYRWYHCMLNFFEYEDHSIQLFMDTLEIVLNSFTFEPEDFDDYYDEAIDILADTPNDSLIEMNSFLTFLQGIEEIKNSELRLAVIKRYQMGEESTYNMISTIFPGYLENMHLGEISDADFEIFCQELDDSLTSYGPLDVEDPFFTDSIDNRLNRAIWNIYSAEDTKSVINKVLKSREPDAYSVGRKVVNRKISSLFYASSTTASSAEVAEVVLYFIVMQYFEGDITKKAVKEAYYLANSIPRIPVVTTAISVDYSETNTILAGYIIDDGGAEITERGIAWAEHYNPTVDANTANPESASGGFTITFTELTEGTTYYARTFATNSVGVAYGNCVSFVPGESSDPTDPTDPGTSIQENQPDNQHFTIYPNPALAITTFNFQLESPESLELAIVDMNGRVVIKNELSSLPSGENQVEFDLSELPEGMYTCQLLSRGRIKATQKLVIAH